MFSTELWGFMDSCIGLIIACLPSLRPYFNWKEKIQYYGNGSEQKTAASYNSRQPMVSSDPDMMERPSNTYLSPGPPQYTKQQKDYLLVLGST
ncbi:unnamed protein product [Fusarium equiseti]|uniref:Uncharacterized protein n=1 Tax=Fusarium equiseti TaxID=61235 RepID=A0A8J2NLF7_FUSEQ|nr:unnamed protein product [Fusarium equiseti]